MAKTGIVRDEFFKKHVMGAFHPECPDRLAVIYAMLDQPDMAGRFRAVYPREATEAEITAVHTPSYYRTIAETAKRPGLTPLDADTTTCPDTFRAAKLAAGGCLALTEAVQNGILDNGFALVRPPGHHAEAGRAMGFCIFNNVAIAAEFLIRQYGLKRILIVDWDLHHGNGTQHSFEANPQVLYFSTHQYPFYPGTGSIDEVGKGAGKGFTLNVPLSYGAGDEEFFTIFRDILQPVAREFAPEFILLSAGFDIHFGDPLGGMQVTAEGFAALTRQLLASADELCQGKLVVTLEGGYGLEGLRDSVKTVLLELVGATNSAPGMSDGPGTIDSLITRVKEIHKPFWKCFSA